MSDAAISIRPLDTTEIELVEQVAQCSSAFDEAKPGIERGPLTQVADGRRSRCHGSWAAYRARELDLDGIGVHRFADPRRWTAGRPARYQSLDGAGGAGPPGRGVRGGAGGVRRQARHGGGCLRRIDMALALAAQIAGEQVAQAIQLGIEYDPQPPFDAGSPQKAPTAVVEAVRAAVVV